METSWDWGRSSAEREPPPGIDVSKPSSARIYDVWVGGKDNFAADREAAAFITDLAPDAPKAARENRALLGRAVRYCIGQGIRQFLDIGTGLPTQGNVHEVALPLAPDAHVVYVDNDPIVLTHARALLAPTGGTTVIQADLRDPESIVAHPETRRLIDFDRPVAVLLAAVLHFVSDERAQHAVDLFRELMAPGGHLLVTHTSADNDPETGDRARHGWDKTQSGITLRGKAQVEHYLDGFELVEPGVTWVPLWRPDNLAATRNSTRWMYAGLGRKP
ncbi:SAM-dependent methyltransferase [Actinomadura scrupuli]|uniref:SAM-dependent methyltransferase n=1 Tax=Actinomadura scrupuli TaxID=559629 RepID=UPI003D973EAB